LSVVNIFAKILIVKCIGEESRSN